MPMKTHTTILVVVLMAGLSLQQVPAFVIRRQLLRTTVGPPPLHAKTAKAPKKTKGTTAPSSGFGGSAIEPCPCGSGNGYMKCCGKLHTDETAYAAATAEQVVRARYSAYAKRVIDFIIGSTHPLNKDFEGDIAHWKSQIDINCYDKFELTKCEILSETYEGQADKESATVAFVANMIQADSRERTAFMETSLFERAGKHIRNGAWLYKSGVISDPPSRNEQDRAIPEVVVENKGDDAQGT